MDNSTATSYINLTYDEEVDVYFAFIAPFIANFGANIERMIDESLGDESE